MEHIKTYRVNQNFSQILYLSRRWVSEHPGPRRTWLITVCLIGQGIFSLGHLLPPNLIPLLILPLLAVFAYLDGGILGFAEFSRREHPVSARTLPVFAAFYFRRSFVVTFLGSLGTAGFVIPAAFCWEWTWKLLPCAGLLTAALLFLLGVPYANPLSVVDNSPAFVAILKSFRLARENQGTSLGILILFLLLPLAGFGAFHYLGHMLPFPANLLLSLSGNVLAAYILLHGRVACFFVAYAKRRRRRSGRSGSSYPLKKSF